MRSKKTIQAILHKVAAFLLVLVTMICITFNGTIITAKAAAGTPGTVLPSDSTQSSQVAALGMSTDQPDRISPSGKEVDKSKNPLGPDNLTLNRIYQFAIFNGMSINVYNNPLGNTRMFKNTPPTIPTFISMSSPVTNTLPQVVQSNPLWLFAEKAVVAVDVDGNGKQEVATIGLLPVGTDGKNVSMHLLVSDYNNIITDGPKAKPNTKDYTLVSSMSNPAGSSNTSQCLQAAAGDFDHDGRDEIAIGAGSSLTLCRADMSTEQTLSTTTISSGSLLTTPIADVEAADANGDGFPELLVTKKAGMIASGGNNTPKLYIYSGIDLSKPSAAISLDVTPKDSTSKEYLRNAGVTVGDAFGTGEKVILLGGTTTRGNVALSYVKFHPETETYDSLPVSSYSLEASDFTAVQGNMGLKCVSLKTPVPGTPQYLVLGGFIFQYDGATDTFIRQDVVNYFNNSDLKGNDTETSHGSITDVNVKKDKTYILNTLVGNFDGNTAGDEQIIMLHYNHWYDNDYVYATVCSMGSDGKIRAVLKQVWKSEKDSAYPHPAIGAPDIYNQGTRLEFEPNKSTFMFSNPSILAVLGATPYYNELKDKYGALGNVGTTYGTEKGSGSSESNGVTASVGVSFGYEKGYLFDNIKIGFETEVTNSFSWQWTSAKSISKSVSFTNYYSDDAVVVSVIPYDVYFYKVYTYDDKTKQIAESEMAMNVPYSPVTTIMPLTDYNRAAASIKNAPVVGTEVLDHTVGDPRSYPQSSSGLSNVDGQDVLLGGTSTNEDENFVAAGVGNNSVEQSITTSSTSEKSFDYELNVNVSFNINVFGLSAGASAGTGYTRNATVSSTASTIRTGAVASVPQGYEGYNFKWCLSAYNYNLKAGDSTQECTVINYLVKPIGSFPPAVPRNFAVKSRFLNATSLKWDPADKAAGYRLYRSTSQDGTYNLIGDLAGKDTASFTDTTSSIGTTYYYRLSSYNSKEAVPASLKVNGLAVTDMSVKTQPKLVYDEGSPLDLSSLLITLKLNDNSTQDIAFTKFTNDITVSLANSTKLAASQTGIPITISYVPDNKSVNTGNLTVNAKSPYDFTLSVIFKVGSTNDAKTLVANQPLSAAITLKNNTPTAQQVLVIMALYSDKGNMVKMSASTANVTANAASGINMNQAFTLPASVSNYTVKVFVWDGKDLSSTTQIPKSNVVQMPLP